YDEVLETQKLLSKHENNNNWLLYEGLLLYYRKNNRWKIVLKNFLSKNKDKKSYERELAKYLISNVIDISLTTILNPLKPNPAFHI
ncbi:MAG: hypothetical protein OEV44_07510, partial [Spirochaetota bacterium]|nr:hypothetical protein [Spirochaetota bacterium]